MIYEHQQKAIEYITEKFLADSQVDALLISGSIAHGFNNESSDVDINIVISKEFYEKKKAARQLTYWESADNFYKGGYFDGKYITVDYLRLVAKSGNEPSRFALHDSMLVFDRTNAVDKLLKEINIYPTDRLEETSLRFFAQFEAWKWYCEEAIKKGNQYLLDMSVTKLILFGGRLILLDNKMFFPYHKWFLRVLESAPDKPEHVMALIQLTIKDKSLTNINHLFEAIANHKNWTNGQAYNWPSSFAQDIELNWMTGNEFIENV